jgi:hypothetical protein
MKNIHVIPTNKEPVKGDLLLRHIWKGEANECISWWRYNDTTMYGDTLVYTTLNGSFMDVPSSFKVQNIYITSDEEIKELDYGLIGNEVMSYHQMHKKWGMPQGKKIILTDNKDLIKDGVQSIDDEFLEWFVKNPSCDSIKKEYRIEFPQRETKQEILEEAAKILYSEVDMINYALYIHEEKDNLLPPYEWFKQFKKK